MQGCRLRTHGSCTRCRGPEYGGELEYLRTFVRQLRKKLEEDPAEPAYLLTDSHIGYRFAEARVEAVPEIR